MQWLQEELLYCTVLSHLTSASTRGACFDCRKRCCTVLYCTEPPYLCQHLQCMQWLREEVLYCTLLYWATLPLPALAVNAVTAGRGVVLYSSVLSHLTSASTRGAYSGRRKRCGCHWRGQQTSRAGHTAPRWLGVCCGSGTALWTCNTWRPNHSLSLTSPVKKEKKTVLNTCLPNTNTMLDTISDAGWNVTVNQHKQT